MLGGGGITPIANENRPGGNAWYDFAGRLLQSGTLPSELTNFEISTATLAEGTYVLRRVNG